MFYHYIKHIFVHVTMNLCSDTQFIIARYIGRKDYRLLFHFLYTCKLFDHGRILKFLGVEEKGVIDDSSLIKNLCKQLSISYDYYDDELTLDLININLCQYCVECGTHKQLRFSSQGDLYGIE